MLTEPLTYDPAPDWPTGLRYIQNGDALNTGNHASQAEDVAQAICHLKGGISGAANVPVLLADATAVEPIKTDLGSITRVMCARPTTDSPDIWTLDNFGVAEQQTSGLGLLQWDLDLPHGAALTAVSAYVTGASGHASLPTGTDRVQLVVGYTVIEGASPSLGSQEDPSATVGAYEAAHPITVTCSHTVDRTQYRYYAYLRSERGANYVQGLKVSSIACTFTPSIYDPR